jgi:5-methyltetrahydrofolate--homocysteine methyltransferase
MVGGAVINQEFATSIGADFYAKDAAESVKLANEFIINNLSIVK